MSTPPPVVERRTIFGASAVLLPWRDATTPDLDAFAAHLDRTIAAGLVPAVNMDTGFGPVLDSGQRQKIRDLTAARGVAFIEGVHTDDAPGDPFDPDAVRRAASSVAAGGGRPILFPCHGMAGCDAGAIVELHRRVADDVGELLAFELGPMFHPAGRIFSTEVFTELLAIPGVVGAKHSSLRRDLEWDRLELRDRLRPEFLLMTGNDLAIDLVVHGSDYLLGLSTFAPDAFALRDRTWAEGDAARFWELNDLLQYLGQFAFRAPVPGYRHDAAMFLALRGWVDSDRSHPSSPSRPDADRDVLAEIVSRLTDLLDR